YGLSLAHKHVPEMKVHGGLTHAPIFAPAVANRYRGMLVEVPLHLGAMPGMPSLGAVADVLAEAYADQPLIRVFGVEESAAMPALTIEQVGTSDRLEIFVFGNPLTGQGRLVAALDNLGKGAAGAA